MAGQQVGDGAADGRREGEAVAGEADGQRQPLVAGRRADQGDPDYALGF